MSESSSFVSRGVAAVWGRSFRSDAAWLGGECVVTPDSITVRALGREHIHPKTDLVELRWIWLPYPYTTIISCTAGEYRFSTFQILGWSNLRSALQSNGYAFTEESRYYWPCRGRDDVRRYALFNAP